MNNSASNDPLNEASSPLEPLFFITEKDEDPVIAQLKNGMNAWFQDSISRLEETLLKHKLATMIELAEIAKQAMQSAEGAIKDPDNIIS